MILPSAKERLPSDTSPVTWQVMFGLYFLR